MLLKKSVISAHYNPIYVYGHSNIRKGLLCGRISLFLNSSKRRQLTFLLVKRPDVGCEQEHTYSMLFRSFNENVLRCDKVNKEQASRANLLRSGSPNTKYLLDY